MLRISLHLRGLERFRKNIETIGHDGQLHPDPLAVLMLEQAIILKNRLRSNVIKDQGSISDRRVRPDLESRVPRPLAFVRGFDIALLLAVLVLLLVVCAASGTIAAAEVLSVVAIVVEIRMVILIELRPRTHKLVSFSESQHRERMVNIQSY